MILISLIVYLLVFKSTNVVDFGLYHAPYIGIINSEKIVIGLTNIHFRFGYSSIIQNSMAIFNIPIFFPKNYLTLTSIFFSSVYLFYFFYLMNMQNFKNYIAIYLFNFFIFIFISIKIYRYNDFGNDMLSNLIIFIIWSKVLEYIFYKNDKINKSSYNNTLIFLLFSSVLATFNKLQFILGILPIFILFIKNNKFFNFKIKQFFYLVFILIITITISTRNFLISGCLQYPITITCSEDVLWSTKNTKSITDTHYNYQKGQAWAKDWPNRIKRYTQNEIGTYEEYNKINNWLPIWIDNHFKKIIKKNAIYFFILISLFIYLSKKKKSFIHDNYRWSELVLLLIIFLCVLIWFLKFPIFRYGYSFILISILLPISLHFKRYKFDNKKIFNNLRKLTIIFGIVFFGLNLNKFYKNKENYSWPNIYQTQVNDDYIIKINNRKIKITTKDVCYYQRMICTNFIPPKELKITYFKNYTIINSNLQYHGAW